MLDTIRNSIIAVDVDLTVVDSLTPWLEWFEYKTGLTFNQDDLKGHRLESVMSEYMDECPLSYWSRTDLYDNLKPIDGSVQFLQDLHSRGNEIIFVTAHTPGHIYSKEEFLNKYFPFHSGIVHTKSKHLVRMDVMIDDNVNVLEEMMLKSPMVRFYLYDNVLNEDYEMPKFTVNGEYNYTRLMGWK